MKRAPSRPASALRSRLVALGAALMLVACATLTLREPPRVVVAGVALDRVLGPDAWFTVDLVLTNRVDRDLTINALDATLAIEGERVADAKLVGPPVQLPANGTASAQLSAHTGIDAILRAVTAAMRRGATIVAPGARPVLHYDLEGTATVEGGLRFAFSKRGELGEGAR
jgi:hypothetical protein